MAGRGPALLRAAYALTGDEHAAHDLVQTALAKAFARASRRIGSRNHRWRPRWARDRVTTLDSAKRLNLG